MLKLNIPDCILIFQKLKMADYWKSNDRKFCDFCKCWITDNKSSVAFHENGRRHKANVAKRISEISRSSAKSEKEKQKMDQELRKMEEAAMRSYSMDINMKSDLTAQSINAVMEAGPSNRPPAAIGGQVDPLLPPNSGFDFDDKYTNGKALATKVPEVLESSMWVEAKSPEEHIYYWNVKTNESIWEKPKEGFMPIDEYNRINEIAVAQQQLQLQHECKKFQDSAPEVVAKYRREQMKTLRGQDPEEKVKSQNRETYKTEQDIQGAAPIGEWQTVVHKAEEHVDLQLPRKINQYPTPIVSEPEFQLEPPVKKFKEKIITKLEPDNDDSNNVFKKRKNVNRGNARQRLDID